VAGRSGDGGTITGCYNTGAVTGNANSTGGVVGRSSDGGTITGCYNTGAVTSTGGEGYWYGTGAGGVVGISSYGGTITACFNTGAVTGTGQSTFIFWIAMLGGVAGTIVDGRVIACYNTGPVTGTMHLTGGVVAYLFEENSTAVTDIKGCYNTGMVTSGQPSYNGTNYNWISTGSVVAEHSIHSAGFPSAPSTNYWLKGTAVHPPQSATGYIEETGLYDNGELATPFNAAGMSAAQIAAAFPIVDGTHEVWGTGDGSENQWWKPSTTTGGQLPRLWYEPSPHKNRKLSF
jgi:hypothetical protein